MLSPQRFRTLILVLVVWTAVVLGRLVQVQLFEHGEWEAESQKQREKTVEVEEPRGEIRTRDGRLLAGSLERVAVYANPRQVARAALPAVAASLAPVLHRAAADILKDLSSRDGFFYLAKDLDPEVRGSIDRLRQRGIGCLRTERRVYPHGSFAAPTVGFIDGEGIGRAGLEATYDRTLRGTPSVYRELRDGKIASTALGLRLEHQGRAGQSLVLTLDAGVQQVVEEELQRTLDEIGARGVAAVVMDVDSGEVLGLGSLPAFDPGKPGVGPAENRHNRVVETSIEPGSTFKPFIVAAALKAGALQPWESVDCSGGGVSIAGVFIHDHARFGVLSLREMLAKSSNAGTIRVAYRTPPEALDETIRAFGFGRPTRIELPAEAAGVYHGPRHWSALSRAGLAIGQEIIVTPIQLAQAYATIANGGVLVHPTLVIETRDPDGTVAARRQSTPGERVLPPDVAGNLAFFLEAVVDEGTGRQARVEGFRVAGKTGTAQKPVAGSYAAGRHAAWFAGFLAMPAPRLAIVVCVDEPKATFWAAEVAAPAFGRIANRLVTLLRLAPSEVVKT